RVNHIFYYRNIGTSTTPAYQLTSTDYLVFYAVNSNSLRFAPAFTDLDDDGDQDLLIGDNSGFLYYLENTSGPNQPMQFANLVYPYKDLFIGLNAVPAPFDINNDGLTDLILGEKNNELNLFENIGT